MSVSLEYETHTQEKILEFSKLLVRGIEHTNITKEIHRLLSQDSPNMLEAIVVLAFYMRDIHEGNGERQIFRDMMLALLEIHPQLVVSLLELVPHYGYWKDVFCLALEDSRLLEEAFRLSKVQLNADEVALREGRPHSLFAKWLPKEGKSMDKFTKEFAAYLYGHSDPLITFSQGMATLRRRVSKLNIALKTLETLQCSNRWDAIVPANVPLVARTKSRAALLNVKSLETDEPRFPLHPQRTQCRENFLRFFKEPLSSTEQALASKSLLEHIHSNRYESIRFKVRKYLLTV
jgi:hypothetical protein